MQLQRGLVLCVLAVLGITPSIAEAGMPPPAPGFTLVAQDDCGNPNQQPHLVTGGVWAFPEDERESLALDDPRLLTCAHGILQGARVVFRFVGLRPTARYIVRIHSFNPAHDRAVGVEADGEILDAARALPIKKLVSLSLPLPPSVYRDTAVSLSFFHTSGPSALVSAIELWSDTPGLLGPTGAFVRFRVDRMPDAEKELTITGVMKIHVSPWTLPGLTLTPKPVQQTGWTPWVDLLAQPGGANGSLVLSLPKGSQGITRFSLVQDDGVCVRDFDWNETDGTKIIVNPDFSDLRTFREQERRYYMRTLAQTGGRLAPLSRPPLFFGNAWGHTTGGAAEYMVKSFRLMGLNSVETSQDRATYESLYGWHSQGGQYAPPGFVPYDENASRTQFATFYKQYFTTGEGKESTPRMSIFQLADEPAEVTPDPQAALPGFRAWLADKGLKPDLFGKDSWDAVEMLLSAPQTPEQKRLFYWSRKYQDFLTPKMFAIAADAVRASGPNPEVQSYVALSGHSLYFGNQLPLDMFQLAQSPGLMPGISDWMTGGSWNWDSHQAVAFSVAPFNGGARRYGADFGKTPLSFPMMHCVAPSLFRAYTQLANQCKFISYYNYGPDYEATEGFWSQSECGDAVQHVNNQAARMDDILGPGTMRPSRVAMLYATSQDIWWPAWPFADKRATFLALSHDYYQPDLVSEEQIAAGALAHYDSLYVLDSVVPTAAQKAIEAWVKAGGLLWACDDAAANNEYAEPHDLLERLGGLKRDYSVAPKVATQVVTVEGENTFPPHEVPVRGRSNEAIRLAVFKWDGARIRATYSDGHPAWAEKKVGSGTVVYVGHRCGLSYAAGAGNRGPFKVWPSERRCFIVRPLEEAQIDRELVVSKPLVMTMPISTAAGTVIILYNMDACEQNGLTITLKEPARPQSVEWCNENGQLTPIPFDYANGRMILTDLNLPWKGTMILVRRGATPADHRIAEMRDAAVKGIAATDWQAASAGAWCAGFFPEWNLAPTIAPLLGHSHWAVRRSAAESLGRLGYRAAENDIRAALDKETDSHSLADELYALAQLGHREIDALCRRYAAHADPFVRSEAARSQAARTVIPQTTKSITQ